MSVSSEGIFMKKLLIAALVLSCVSSFAGSIDCSVVTGEFDNSLLKMSNVIIESNSTQTNLVNAEKLMVNILGNNESFSKTGLTVANGSKLDFELDSNPSVKAVLLINKSAGEIKRKFKGLIVITGTGIEFSQESVPFFSTKSLVYNLNCKMH